MLYILPHPIIINHCDFVQFEVLGIYVKSHEMDSLWAPVRNSGGHIITIF